MTLDYAVCAVLSLCLTAYLVFALIRPEKF
jgi:K+-transporting ATPase KdpF subunit